MGTSLSALLGALLATSGAPLASAPAPAVARATGAFVEPLKDERGVEGLRSTFVVDAPADAVLNVLWDVSRFKSIFPEVRDMQVLAHHPGNTIDVRFEIDAVVASPSYTLRRCLTPAAAGGGEVSWLSIAGDIKSIRGSWLVVPIDATRCRVIYTSFVDVGPVFVSGMVRGVAMRKATDLAERVRAAARRYASAAPAH